MPGYLTMARHRSMPAVLRHPTRIATVSNTSGSTAFQAVGPDGYTNARAELGNEDRTAHTTARSDSPRPQTHALSLPSRLTPNVYFRVFKGGNPNDIGSWGSTRTVGKGDEPRLASGPHGLYLMYRRRVLLRDVYVVRHFAGPDFGPSTTVSSAPTSGAGPLSGRTSSRIPAEVFTSPGSSRTREPRTSSTTGLPTTAMHGRPPGRWPRALPRFMTSTSPRPRTAAGSQSGTAISPATAPCVPPTSGPRSPSTTSAPTR